MTAEEATVYLNEQMRQDNMLRNVRVGVLETTEYDDIYAWAEAEPQQVVIIAESWADVVSQTPPGLPPL